VSAVIFSLEVAVAGARRKRKFVLNGQTTTLAVESEKF
jgi:hypothetical protein